MKNMKKSFLLFVAVVFSAAALQARTVDLNTTYVGSSDFIQAKASATAALAVNAFVGLEARYVDDKLDNRPYYGGFKDPIYSVRLPIRLDLELVTVRVTPFYYFTNDSDNKDFQDASAYGVNALFSMNMQHDEVDDLYTQAYIGVSYGRQKGTLFKDSLENGYDNQYYSEMAYTLGLRKNFYQAFVFDVAGSVFQYPDGITGVNAFRGVMDQQDLAFTQSFDIIRDLPKYTVGTRLTRVWMEEMATLYAGYRYGEFYTAKPEHSILVGNTFVIAKAIKVDLAYNHLMTVHSKNKRDILYVSVGMSF